MTRSRAAEETRLRSQQRPNLHDPVSNGARGLGNQSDRFGNINGFDDCKTGDREWRGHEGRISGLHAFGIWIANLNGRPRSTNQRAS
jgi:hypothetical protein